MNIFLIPYSWIRHIHVALVTSSAALLAWWAVLSWFVLLGPAWSAEWDGPVLLSAVSGATAGASMLSEGSLRRAPPLKLFGKTLGAAALAVLLTVGGTWLWGSIMLGDHPDGGDPTLVSLRYELGAFLAAGFGCAVGPLAARKGEGWLNHLLAGAATALAAAAVWHICSYTEIIRGNDLFLASGLMSLTWGGVYGLLAWGIPDRLYAGWVRILSPTRFARRIPIDAPDGTPKERFIGRWVRGLDLWVPHQEGAQELHISVAVDSKQRYAARGLSLYPTRILRFLEKIDLRYDPRRPAPLKTRLYSGDRIEIGDGESQCVVEFIMLPREER